MSTRDVGSICHNIENIMLLGAAQHVSGLLASVTEWPGALMLCALVAAADHGLLAWRRALASSLPRQVLSQVNVVVFSQKLFEQIATSAPAMHYTQSSWLSLLALARSTMLLVALASLPHGAHEDAYRARVESLLLYMYSENIEVHAARLNARLVLFALAVGLQVRGRLLQQRREHGVPRLRA
jgi:hypothetical protein